MYATCSALAPSSASQPPIVMIATRRAETSSSTTTSARVSFDDALLAVRVLDVTPAGSSMATRPYNLAAVHAALAPTRTHRAGVAELVDARGLGPRGHKPWGFESLRPHSVSLRTSAELATRARGYVAVQAATEGGTVGVGLLDRDRTVAPMEYARWLIPPAALAVHLSIGQVYAFSVFKKPLVEHFDTTLTPIGWIFSIAILMLGLSAAFGGTWVERSGPRKAMFVAACCWGTGFLVAALGVATDQLWVVYLGYGVIGGIGLGIGYISPVSTLIKWFPDRPGMATGLAIMGFGGGALIAAPLSNKLLDVFGDQPADAIAPGVRHARRHLLRRHDARRDHRAAPRRRVEAGGLEPRGAGRAADDHDRATSRPPTRSARRSSGSCGSCCAAT